MPTSRSRRARLAIAAVMASGALAAASVVVPVTASAGAPEIQPHLMLTKGAAQAKTSGGSTTNSGIYYHGGPVIHAPNVEVIYYGDFTGASSSVSTDTFPTVVDQFASALGSSSYFNINTTYKDSNGNVQNVLTHTGSVTVKLGDSEWKGYSLSDSQVQQVVFSVINNRLGGSDPSTVYALIGSRNANLTSGFGTKYCGWHTYGTNDGVVTKYAAMIDPERAPSACEASQLTSPPNGDRGADAVVSILAHEVEEAATDPQLNAWYDKRGYENADKCAWTFGTVTNSSNVTLGTHQYLIQRNWVNSGSGGCLQGL